MASAGSTSNVSGTVITFDGSKGLGFIRADGSEEWIRFTTKDIVDGGDRGAIERNQPVRFDVVTSSVGLVAINVSFADSN